MLDLESKLDLIAISISSFSLIGALIFLTTDIFPNWFSIVTLVLGVSSALIIFSSRKLNKMYSQRIDQNDL